MKIYLPNGATQLISTLFAHQSSISVGSEGALQLEGLPPQAFQLWQKKYFWGEAQFFVTPLSKDIEILRNGMLLSESTQVLNNDKITVLGQTLTFDLAANAKRFSLANKVLSISILLSIILSQNRRKRSSAETRVRYNGYYRTVLK